MFDIVLITCTIFFFFFMLLEVEPKQPTEIFGQCGPVVSSDFVKFVKCGISLCRERNGEKLLNILFSTP